VSASVLESWFAAGLPPEVRAWWTSALASTRQSGPGGTGFVAAWSAAGRRLGRAPVDAGDDAAAALRAQGAPLVPAEWGVDEVGRVLLLLAAAEAPASAGGLAPVVDELFRMGEMREQQAVLRALAYLPQPEQFVPLAADAVRSNVVSVLEALACENPFPAKYVPEAPFNQMVMKCLFNDVSLHRVLGLAERNNDELRRIVGDYIKERRSAGRVVPPDVALILKA
jgi:hypothetical protein